jgi:DNA-binding beta-propeller fold protein YncE
VDNDILHLTLIQDECKARAAIFGTQAFEKVVENNTNAILIWEIPAIAGGIATDSQGNVYLTDGGAFSKYDANGKLLGSWAGGLTYTEGIAVDAQGNIYVANFDPPAIHKFSPDGTPLLDWTIADGVGPIGLAVDSQGNIYTALHRLHDQYIEKYDPLGTLLGIWAKPETAGGQIIAGPRSGPGAILVDAQGDNYITDAGTQVHKYDKDGKFLYDIPYTGGTTIDTQGNLYVFVFEENTILKFDSNGKQIGRWLVPIGKHPGWLFSIAIDPDGNILISSFSVLAKLKLPEQ